MPSPIRAVLPLLVSVLSCTAYVDQPRPVIGTRASGSVEKLSSIQLPFNAPVGSIGLDRMGRAGYTDESGWSLVSVGQDGDEAFRLSLIRPRQMLLPGGGDGWRLLNDIDRRVKLYDRNGAEASEVSYDGFSARAGAATSGGDIYLLDAERLEVKAFDRRGGILQKIGLEIPGEQFRPGSLAVEPSLNLMAMGDYLTGIIAIYNLYGSLQAVVRTKFGDHRQVLSLDYLGRLWVCKPLAGAVSIYGPRAGDWVLLQDLPFNQPYALAMGPFGSGVVAEPGRLVFVRF